MEEFYLCYKNPKNYMADEWECQGGYESFKAADDAFFASLIDNSRYGARIASTYKFLPRFINQRLLESQLRQPLKVTIHWNDLHIYLMVYVFKPRNEPN